MTDKDLRGYYANLEIHNSTGFAGGENELTICEDCLDVELLDENGIFRPQSDWQPEGTGLRYVNLDNGHGINYIFQVYNQVPPSLPDRKFCYFCNRSIN